jgi:hypothetical protein
MWGVPSTSSLVGPLNRRVNKQKNRQMESHQAMKSFIEGVDLFRVTWKKELEK